MTKNNFLAEVSFKLNFSIFPSFSEESPFLRESKFKSPSLKVRVSGTI